MNNSGDDRRRGISRALTLALTLVALLSTMLTAQDEYIVKVDNFRKDELYCKGFKVLEPTSIQIKAIGALHKNGDEMAGYAWIMRSGSLQPVWVMEKRNTDEYDSDSELRIYDSQFELEPGEYEAYFYAGVPGGFGSFDFKFNFEMLEEILDEIAKELGKAELNREEARKELDKLRDEFGEGDLKVFVDYDDEESSEIVESYSLQISGNSNRITGANCNYYSDQVVAEILRPDHNEYTSIGFTLTEPMEVEIAALGEVAHWSETFADYGWIINASTRERVWSMAESRLRWAGGAEKNKFVQESVYLEEGDYLLYYVTDDSHVFDDWNAAPPYKPEAYGIRVSALERDDLDNVKPYRDTYSREPLLAIVGARDEFLETRPFEVEKPADVRVYAIGEYVGDPDRDEPWADYAWIERLDEPDIVWQMSGSESEPAGGAKKNRMVDQMIHLPQGQYLLGYVTDDSHSYGDWNASPPYDQKNYGVTLFPPDKNFDPSIIRELTSVEQSDDILVQLTRIGDHADVSRDFELDKPTRVRIIALGEGDDGRMYDFGWIENRSGGEIVWEMTYRKTEEAGGADKNRMVDTEIMLDEGKYTVHYVSDGSHSFGRWNTTPPRFAQRWGITVSLAK